MAAIALLARSQAEWLADIDIAAMGRSYNAITTNLTSSQQQSAFALSA